MKLRALLYTAVILLCFSPVSILGQSMTILETEDDVLRFCETVMGMLLSEEYQAAFDAMTAVAVPQMSDDLYNLQVTTREQIDGVQAVFGGLVGYERLRVQNLRNVVMEVLYIQKFENHGLRWQFIFYKPTDEWLLDNLQWDDQISLLFEWGDGY